MGFFDKLTGKAKREEEARLAAERIAEVEARLAAEDAEARQRKAEERKAKREAKKAAEKQKKNQQLSSAQLKEQATAAGEPYINILGMELDPEDINSGAFELDWNDKFVLNLIRAGYKFKDSDSDQMIVERWFQNVCRNVALELYEQEQADPANRDVRMIKSKDIGNGRSEVS